LRGWFTPRRGGPLDDRPIDLALAKQLARAVDRPHGEGQTTTGAGSRRRPAVLDADADAVARG
jgi:hypothetical protein